MNHFNVFKGGKILPGLVQDMLDNMQMTTDSEPPNADVRLTKIYDLKPLQHAHSVLISLFSLYDLVF